MAWTGTPKTWAFQEGVESSELNTEVRDRFLAVGPHLIARKTSDQSVTSSTTLVDDTALQLTVGINEVWLLHFILRYEASVTGDIKVSASFPSGEVNVFPSGGILAANGTFTDQGWVMTTSDASAINWTGGGAGSPRTSLLDGTYIVGGTGGTLKLRWAQNSSDATPTKMLTHSTLWAVKLA